MKCFAECDYRKALQTTIYLLAFISFFLAIGIFFADQSDKGRAEGKTNSFFPDFIMMGLMISSLIPIGVHYVKCTSLWYMLLAGVLCIFTIILRMIIIHGFQFGLIFLYVVNTPLMLWFFWAGYTKLPSGGGFLETIQKNEDDILNSLTPKEKRSRNIKVNVISKSKELLVTQVSGGTSKKHLKDSKHSLKV